MGFGGRRSQQIVYVPQTDNSAAEQAEAKAAKEKQQNKEKHDRSRQYGLNMSDAFRDLSNRYAGSVMSPDTTLASGSLLSLGGTLGG